MPVEYKQHNGEFEIDFPGDPAYTETGSNTAAAIQRYNNNEDANEDVLRRPVEQLRRRSRHVQEEFNLLESEARSREGRFVDMRSAALTWNGLTHGTVAKRGVFELSSSIFVAHPLYPASLYEIPQTIIGNETTGFFNDEYNRLKEEGDSLWVVFGAKTDDSIERDLVSRAQGSSTITQSQLRKGPTWVMIRDSVTDLSAAGIVKGSDKLRIYPDPIGSPATVVTRVIRDIFQDTSGHWYVEVAHDDPLWDQSIAAHVPPSTATTKRTRPTNSAEYSIVDTTEVTTRVTQRTFASYHSNLEWFGAGRVDPLVPYGVVADDYRGNEWANAVPIAMVSNGNLFFPLAGSAGVAPGTSGQSVSGFVRTSLQDSITANHLWKQTQTFTQAADANLIDLRTNSGFLAPGEGSHVVTIDEAHTDGITDTPSFWASPNRPGRMRVKGYADGYANPVFEIVEQGMYEAGGAYRGKENAIRLRRMLEGSYVPLAHGATYSELTASQMPYILSTNNVTPYSRSLEYSMDDATIPTITGQGLALGTFISLGDSGVYETMRGKHDLLIQGHIALRDIYPVHIAVVAGIPAGVPKAANSQSIRFFAHLRLTPDPAVAANPMAIAVQTADPQPFIHTTMRDCFDIAAVPSPTVSFASQETYQDLHTVKTLTPDGGNENRSYPAVPAGGSVLVYQALFANDVNYFTGAGPYETTHFPRHSEILVRLIALPFYDGGSGTQRIAFYLQFDFHNEEGDAVEVDFLRKNMYTKNFANMFAASNPYGVDPYLACHLNVLHVPLWDVPFA